MTKHNIAADIRFDVFRKENTRVCGVIFIEVSRGGREVGRTTEHMLSHSRSVWPENHKFCPPPHPRTQKNTTTISHNIPSDPSCPILLRFYY